MPDFNIASLEAVTSPARRGAGIALSSPPAGAVVQVLGSRGDTGLAGRLAAFASEAHAVRPLGPDQYLVVLSRQLDRGGMAELQAAAGDAGLVDQTHGRARIVVEGAKAREVLAKGTGVDLHPAGFPEGRSAVTLFGHIGAQVTRTGDERFELLPLRSFAGSLWDDLVHMADEFLDRR